MLDRKSSQDCQSCKYGFIPAEQYVRQLPLHESVLSLSTYHAINSRRVIRSMADLVAGYHLRKCQTVRSMKAVI